MHRTGPAERDEREFARVVASLHRQRAHTAAHVVDGYLDDALGEPVDVRHADARGELPDAAQRRLVVELHAAAGDAAGAEAAEDQVGVGDGDLGAAAAIADRSGEAAGALRTD